MSTKPSPDCTELVWVTPTLARKYNATTNPDSAEAVMHAATSKLAAEVQTALADLDDDILVFKARGLAYRDAYNAAFESEADKAYAIWEQHEDRLDALRKDAESRLKGIRDLTAEVQAANINLLSTLEQVSTYKVEHLADNLQRIHDLSRSLTPETVTALQIILGVSILNQEDS